MLQGSLDNFTIPEILGLLATTSKTGRLKVSGDRGTGSVWCRDGMLELAEASKLPGSSDIDDVMLELLRYGSGNFSFQLDEPLPAGAEVVSEPVDVVLAGAASRLDEWLEIEAVVPSMAHSLTPAAELPKAEATIKADEWEFLVAIGDSRTVGDVAKRLGLGEIDVSRRAKGLIERELVEIGEHPGRRSADLAPADLAPADLAPAETDSAAIDDPAPVGAPFAEPVEAVEPAMAEPVLAEPVLAEPAGNEPASFQTPVAEPAPVADPLEIAGREEPTEPAEETPAFASPAFDEPATSASEAADPAVNDPVIEDMLATIAMRQAEENRVDQAAPTETGDAAFAIDSGLAPTFAEPASDMDSPFEPAEPLPAPGVAPSSLGTDADDINSLRDSILTKDDDEQEDSSVLMQFLNNDR